MAIREIVLGTYVDDAMPDGYLRVRHLPAGFPSVTMSQPTWDSVIFSGTEPEMYAAADQLPEGDHLIPMSVLDAAAVREVERVLEFAEPGETSNCVMPGCLQDVVSSKRGYSLCAGHEADLADWDSLTA